MSDEKTRVQIFLAMNENCDCGVGFSSDDATEALRKDYGGFGSCLQRVVVIDVLMSPPRLVDGGEVDIPDEAGEAKAGVSMDGDLPEASRAAHHSG